MVREMFTSLMIGVTRSISHEYPSITSEMYKKALEKFQDKIAGVVLNKLPEKKNHYYSYYN